MAAALSGRRYPTLLALNSVTALTEMCYEITFCVFWELMCRKIFPLWKKLNYVMLFWQKSQEFHLGTTEAEASSLVTTLWWMWAQWHRHLVDITNSRILLKLEATFSISNFILTLAEERMF